MAGKREQAIEVGKKTRFSSDNQPANPGRKKKLPELDTLLADVLGSEDESGQHSEAKEVLTSLLKQAKNGNVRAAEVILNRAYGMPLQRTENKNTHEFKPDGLEVITPEKLQALENILGDGTSDKQAKPIPGKRQG